MKDGIEKKAIAGRIVPGRAGAPFPQPEQCHCARIALNAPRFRAFLQMRGILGGALAEKASHKHPIDRPKSGGVSGNPAIINWVSVILCRRSGEGSTKSKTSAQCTNKHTRILRHGTSYPTAQEWAAACDLKRCGRRDGSLSRSRRGQQGACRVSQLHRRPKPRRASAVR